MEEKKISVAWTVFWIVVFFPVAIYRMWKYNQFSKNNRIIFTGLIVVGNLIGMLWSLDLSKKIRDLKEEV